MDKREIPFGDPFGGDSSVAVDLRKAERPIPFPDAFGGDSSAVADLHKAKSPQEKIAEFKRRIAQRPGPMSKEEMDEYAILKYGEPINSRTETNDDGDSLSSVLRFE
jgi:hypothetical protein